ncbi:MAG: sodium:proton exchanger, partial [Bacteroidetes bacterium]|nr:sodium:proton exchanger [Bacteroidota bacterium]
MILAAVSLSFLNELVVVIVASVVGAYVCYRIGLVSILGFLLAGVVIGPHAFGWVQEQVLIDILAELGVILLLFSIGVELSIDKMSRLARAVVIGVGLQVAITSAVVLGLGLVV